MQKISKCQDSVCFWETSGRSRERAGGGGGGGRPHPPPLYLDQNEAPPLSEGLDPPLETHLFWIVTIKT